ncbi:MAG: hypothetical protein F6K19_39725 [Cyanothece sp. SIO1E1]|nr:hypothetical protein [Cyanothece sp. SIO1E1]
MQLKVYAVVIGGLCLAIAALLIGRFEIEVAVEPTATNPLAPEAASPTELPRTDNSTSAPAAQSIPNVEPSSTTSPAIPAPNPAASNSPAASSNAASDSGKLRVSNQTNHPIRIALLTQRPESGLITPSTSPADTQSLYDQPAHWDFAPAEGSRNGLLLSLPDLNLQLKTGDVLMAFAQDGSRLYWGPYVVGKTSLPTWNPQSSEWLLVIGLETQEQELR